LRPAANGDLRSKDPSETIAGAPHIEPAADQAEVLERPSTGQGRLNPAADHAVLKPAVFLVRRFDPVALLNSDTRRLDAVLKVGCTAPEHAALLTRLSLAKLPSQSI
jgi:hypothetical protein